MNAPRSNSVKHRYRKVALRMWGDDRFACLSALPPSGQSLWLYLLACPLPDTIPGVYRTGRASLAEDLGWEIDEFDRCFNEIAALGMAKADWKAKLMWLPNAAKYNQPESPSVVIFWSKAWAEIPECDMKTEVYNALKTHICAIGRGFADAFTQNFVKPEPPSNGGRKQAVPQAGRQGVPQAASSSDGQADGQAAVQPGRQAGRQAGRQGVPQPAKPLNGAANQAVCQPGGQGVPQGVPHLELELEQEQYGVSEDGGVGEECVTSQPEGLLPRGASPSAQSHSSSDFDSRSQRAVPAGSEAGSPSPATAPQAELDGFDYRGLEVIDEVDQAIREAQTKTGTRLPVGYVVPEAWLTSARKTRPDLPVEQLQDAAAQFVGYWSAKPGREGLKLNWLSTWLNWVRKERAPAGDSPKAARLQTPSQFSGSSRAKDIEMAKKYGFRIAGVYDPAKPHG